MITIFEEQEHVGEQDYTSSMGSARVDCIDPHLASALEDTAWNLSPRWYKYLRFRVAVTSIQNLTRNLSSDGGRESRIGKPQSDNMFQETSEDKVFQV